MVAKATRPLAGQSQLFLRIKHPALDPAEITATLGIQPEHAVKAGDDISTAGVRRLFNETYWLAALPSMSAPAFSIPVGRKPGASTLSDFAPGLSKEDIKSLMHAGNAFDFVIIAWLRKLEPQREFFARLNQSQGTVTLLLNRANREAAFTITPMLAQRLVNVGVALEID